MSEEPSDTESALEYVPRRNVDPFIESDTEDQPNRSPSAPPRAPGPGGGPPSDDGGPGDDDDGNPPDDEDDYDPGDDDENDNPPDDDEEPGEPGEPGGNDDELEPEAEPEQRPETRDEALSRRFAEALERIANTFPDQPAGPPQAPVAHAPSIGKSSAARAPDTFSGEDPEKLDAFLMQCRLYFRTRRDLFPNQSAKVNFAMTYLTGTAQRWFHVGIEMEEDWGVVEDWSADWPKFVIELRARFGVTDRAGEAATNLENLHMDRGDKITTYNVEFLKYSSQLDWNDEVLRHRYYSGLPFRLQDLLSAREKGKPKTFQGMIDYASRYDGRYWEREREKSHLKSTDSGKKTAASSTATSAPTTSTSSFAKAPSKTPAPYQNSATPALHQKSSTPAPPSKAAFTPAKPDLTDKLGKDGKLTAEERKRRVDGNLCLFCGYAGHKVNECRKRQSTIANAQARRAEACASISESIVDSGN